MTSFDIALRDNPRVFTIAQVMVERNPVGAPFQVVGGQVQIDETAQYWRSLQNLEIVDPDGGLAPIGASDLLAPYGNELQVYNGVVGQPVQPVGLFRIAQDDIVYLGGGDTIAIAGYDRSRQLSRNQWDKPHVIPPGVNVIVAAQAIASDRLPGVEFDVRTSTAVVTGPVMFKEGDDPWAGMQIVLSPAGIEPLFGPTGRLIIRDIPQLTGGNPAVVYTEGEGSHITQLSSTLSDDPGVNRVILLAQTSSLPEPLSAVSEDTSTSSLTNVESKYGVVTAVVSNTTATTQLELQTIADNTLQRLSGGSVQLRISALNDSRREAGDVLEVHAGRISDLHIVSSITLDLGLGDMSIVTRKTRVA